MKILIASTPAAGHLNPLLSVASLLTESDHEVAVQVNEDLRTVVEASGHRFLSEIPNAQTSGRYFLENYPRAHAKVAWHGDDRPLFRSFLRPQYRRPVG